MINNNEFIIKNKKITILKYFSILLIILFLLILGFIIKIYNKKTLFYLILISFIIYIIIIFYKTQFDYHEIGKNNTIKFSNDYSNNILKQLASDLLPNFMTRNRCPSQCKHKKFHPNKPINPQIAKVRDMYTDSTLDNWTDGNILYRKCNINDKNGKLECPINNNNTIIFNNPKPWYKNINKNLQTIYTCEWNGTGEPLGEQGSEFLSRIPCNYYPGYKTTNKSIS
jgi:hypothetical protein